jgi:coproporphyrinogen III oxidase-like Fe-S oxidoreductase
VGQGSPAPAQIEKRSPVELENEAVWLALRTSDGIDRAAHAARFGADPLVGREAAVARAVACRWLEVSTEYVRPTPAGLMCADELAAQLWR